MKNLLQLLNESSYLFEDELFEDTDNKEEMSDEELKVESLKIATNIAKLMSDVTPDDIISIASKVSDFIKNHEIASEEKKKEESDMDFINNDLK